MVGFCHGGNMLGNHENSINNDKDKNNDNNNNNNNNNNNINKNKNNNNKPVFLEPMFL